VVGDGSVKIDLVGADGEPVIVRSIGMKDRDQLRAWRIVRENQAFYLRLWREMHG
jgi:hypothetical protein